MSDAEIVDQESRAVRDRRVAFTKRGAIDTRCSACKQGALQLREDGRIDWRSSLVTQGEVRENKSCK